MSRQAIYPWATLEKVGDYFIVTEEMRPSAHYFMNATVAQRNKHMSGRMKYCCIKTTYGCIVMVAQVGEDLPPYDYEVIPGLFAVANFDATATQPLGNRPQARELTMQEKIDRLPPAVKFANLPWWWENGKFFWNGGNIQKYRKEDIDARFANNLAHFAANKPYPDFYNLDENFRIRQEETLTDDEDEDFGPDPIFTEEQESDGDDT